MSSSNDRAPNGANATSPSDLRARFEPHTLPLWPVGEDGRCTCAEHPHCRRPGKHPASDAPGPGYAVITGAKSGLFVVDPDVKGDVNGIDQLEQFLGGSLPKDTLTIATPSGGLHFYHAHTGSHVGGHKFASAVDIKGDGELVYVVGPGSPGYVKTSDPCVVLPSFPYTALEEGAAISPAPERLLAWLRIGTGTREGFAPEPITEEHPDWDYRVRLAIEACQTMAPSKADGEGGKRLFNLALHLVRRLELPLDSARELVVEHFNPRCTTPDGAAYPWEDADILHKLEDAAEKSNVPTGILSAKTLDGFRALGKPYAARITDERIADLAERVAKTARPGKTRSKVTDPEHSNALKKSLPALTQMLYGHPDWEGVLWKDVHLRQVIAVDPPIEGKLDIEGGAMTNSDLSAIEHWLNVQGVLTTTEQLKKAIDNVTKAPDRQRNALAMYLDSLPVATEATVLPTLATDVFGADDAFANVLVMKHLVAAALRARNAGTSHKPMLVLYGKQKIGKTPAVKILAGAFYHSIAQHDLADRMTLMACRGKMLVEFEEMSGLKRDDATLKALISLDADTLDVKFEPLPQTYPRSWVGIATTNKPSFLTDASGDTRYWVVRCQKIDLARLEQLRDVIWAEADFLARTMPERWNYLDDTESALLSASNEQHRRELPLLPRIAAGLRTYVKTLAAKDRIAKTGNLAVDVTMVWDWCREYVSTGPATGRFSGNPTPSTAEQTQIEECLESIGFEKRSRKNGTRPRFGADERRPSTWWEVTPEKLVADDGPRDSDTAAHAPS